MRSLKRTVVLKVDPSRPDKKMILRAAKKIKSGALVAFPTETVYGLGANAALPRAVKNLCKVKNRPEGKPFTLHIHSVSMIKKAGCKVTKEVKALIDKYWPGPLTIILARNDGGKLGFRMPANKVALDLLRASGVPVAAPSANISGRMPPKDAGDVLKQLTGKIDILVDAGPADIGVESTVVDMTFTSPRILRQGAIKEKEILNAIYGKR